MLLKPWHCRAFLIISVLLVYYPSLHGGFNSIDDLKMLNDIDAAGQIDISGLFFPQGTVYYYRPLLYLSFFFDRDLWGLLASFMHLENILLHLGATLLVFSVACRILCQYKDSNEPAALVAGLFFALHPLATESVCWVSGRTDLMVGFFLLLSVWLLVISLQHKSTFFSILSGVAMLCACLSKEVGVFILPGMLWFVLVFPSQNASFLHRLRERWLALIIPVGAIAVYFVMRQAALANDTGVGAALKGVTAGDYDLLNKIRVAFKVYGFYFKKIFVPWPLNFAIYDISGWYVLVGGILLALLCWVFVRADLLGACALMAFCVLSPALLVVIGHMTWTPIAERYLYSTLALCSPVLVIAGFNRIARMGRLSRRRWKVASITLLLVFATTTLHRSWVWADNLRFYHDTAQKSPDSVAVKNELAAALRAKGRSAEAEAILVEMQTDGGDEFLNDDLVLAQQLAARGNFDAGRKILIEGLGKNSKKYLDLLQVLIRMNDQRLAITTEPAARSAIQNESLAWLLEKQRLRPQPFTLYRLGKQYLSMGRKSQALDYFRKAYVQAPADAYYRSAAATFIAKLENH